MARARNIKPGFFANDVLAECDPLARLLFAGLWTVADRAGRLEDRPKKLKAGLLPYDNCDIDALLDQLAGRGFIDRYMVGADAFIQILTWEKHQNPHVKESPSEIPARGQHSASTGQEPDSTQPQPERAGLIPDPLNLIPDPPIPGDGGVAESNPGPGAVCKAIRAKGVMDVNPSNPELRALIAQGVSVEAFEAAAEKCAKGSPPKGMAYLLAIVKRQLSEAASIAAGPAAVSAVVDPDSMQAVIAEGVAKGIGPWNEINEQWHIYKARVRGPKQPGLSLEALAGMAQQRQGVH